MAVAGTAALVAGIAGPLAWSLVTIGTTHTGSVPDVGPAQAAARGGFPGAGGPRRGAGFDRRDDGQAFSPGGAPVPGGPVPGGPVPGGSVPGGSVPGGSVGGSAGAPVGGPMGAPGGFRGGQAAVNAELVTALKAGASGYRWVAAASSSMTAGPLQLAVDAPVMSLGGFGGQDPAITLERFKALVSSGQVHYFIADGMGGMGGMGAGPGGGRPVGAGAGSGNGAGNGTGNGAGNGAGDGMRGAGPFGRGGATSAIAQWVSSTFTATTVGSVTVYDLSRA